MTGRTLSHYQILEQLGSGGMGEVYKARDTKLNRFVAIKVLKAEHVAHASRKQRFIQEAQAASALNHPNIVTIHEIDQRDGIDFMVMEFITGKTLDARIPRQGMRLNEALRVAVQVAEGLRRAHAAGIVHRDLKPSNIMVADDGLVKVLDFGLAKLTERAPISQDEETRTERPETEEGTVLGTTPYMSPEQAEGRKLDERTDIFSFGVVLYEMLTGRRPFDGGSRAATVSAIIKEEPKPVQNIPPELDRILRRCLRKDRERRFQHLDDLRVALLEVKDDSESGLGEPVPARAPAKTWQWPALAGVLAIAALGAFVWIRSRPSKETTVSAQKMVPLTSLPGVERHPSFSPDGNQVAFSWNGEKRDNFDIYVKLVGAPNVLRLTSSPEDDKWPAWSPDGRQIAFIRSGAVYTVPAIGGPEQKVGETRSAFGSVSWHPHGRQLVVEHATGGLALVPVAGGETKIVTTPPSRQLDSFGVISPDGRSLAFARLPGGLAELVVKTLGSGEEKTLVRGRSLRSRPAWLPNSRDLIYSEEGLVNPPALYRIDTSGLSPKPVALGGSGPGANDPAADPGREGRLVFSHQRFDTDIWRYGLGPGPSEPRKIIASTFMDQDPQYSPDGRQIAYVSHSTGTAEIWRCDAEGRECRALTSHGLSSAGPPRWSPDAQTIVFAVNHPGNVEIHAVPAEGGPMRNLSNHASSDRRPSVSRDGKWLYFTSNRSGRSEVWKSPVSGGDAIQVTRNGGFDGFEAPDGKLFYFHKRMRGIWSAPVGGGEEVLVTPQGRDGCWGVAASGLYFVDWDDSPTSKAVVAHYSFATKQTRTLVTLPRRPEGGPRFSIAPDEKSFLVALPEESEADLILIEGAN